MKIASGVTGTSRTGEDLGPITNPVELVTFPNHGPSSGGEDAETEFGV